MLSSGQGMTVSLFHSRQSEQGWTCCLGSKRCSLDPSPPRGLYVVNSWWGKKAFPSVCSQWWDAQEPANNPLHPCPLSYQNSTQIPWTPCPAKEKDTKAEAKQGGQNWQKWNQGEQQKPGKILIKIGSVWTCYNETELMHANKNIQTENLNYTYGITCVWTCVYLQYWTHHQKSSHVSWRYLPGFNPQQRQRERPLHRAGPGPGGCTEEVIRQLH